MEELAKATNRAAKVMEFSAIQMSVNARVSHYILFGQNRKALALTKESESTLQPPQSIADDEGIGGDEEDVSVHDVQIDDSRAPRKLDNDNEDDEDDSDSENEPTQQEAV
jgi:hypothetical protein